MINFNDALLGLRMQSPDFMSGAMEPTPQPQHADIDAIFGYPQGYQPQTQANDMLMQMIQNFPQREEPGRLRQIAGLLAGLGAGVHPAGMGNGQPVGFEGGTPQQINAAQDMATYPKFNREMGDWLTKVKPVETAAANERMFNQNERMNINNYAARTIASKREEDYANEIASKSEARKAGTQIKYLQGQINAAAEARKDWQMRHPDKIVKEDENGYLIGVDKQGLTYTRVTDAQGRPVKGSTLPDATKIERIHTNRMSEIDEAGNQRGLNIQRQGEETRKNIVGRKAATNETPSQYRERLKNNMRLAIAQHPEWEQFVDLNSGKAIYGGNDEVDRMLFNMAIFGTPGGDVNLPSDKPNSTVPPPTAPKPSKPGNNNNGNLSTNNALAPPQQTGKGYRREQLAPPPAGYSYIADASGMIVGKIKANSPIPPGYKLVK